MSNSNSPRVLKVKRLPKGRFTWKVTLNLQPGNKLCHYDRYYEDRNALTPEMHDYLSQSVHGKFAIHYVDHIATRRKDIAKADAIYFDNQIDVSLFKLCYGYAIRRIYKIVVESKQDMEKAA